MESISAAVHFIRSNWDTELEVKPSELWYSIGFAFFFAAVRYALDNSIYEGLGRRFILNRISWNQQGTTSSTQKPANDVDKDALLKVHVKFKESCWKSSYFLSSVLLIMFIASSEPWLEDTKSFWVSGSRTWPDIRPKLKITVMYLYLGGFFMYSIFALLFWETRRQDWIIHLGHHIVLSALWVFTYNARMWAPFICGLAFHDATDVFLELAKISKYMQFEICANVVFVIFAVSWVYFRLWLFPKLVVFGGNISYLNTVEFARRVPYPASIIFAVTNLALCLYVFNLYWWVLILRVVYRQVKSGGVEGDVRSDDEDED